MKKQRVARHFFTLTLFSAITIMTWIGLEVYWAVRKEEKVVRKPVPSLNPKLDQEIIERLKAREAGMIAPLQPTLSPTPGPNRQATPSATLTPTPESSPSGGTN